jgi:hypothetical protein
MTTPPRSDSPSPGRPDRRGRGDGAAGRARTRLAVGAVAGALLLAGTSAAVSAADDSAPKAREEAPDYDPLPLVVDARYGQHKTFDRFVVDIEGDPPKVEAEVVRSLHHDGSGDPVALKGRYFLQVRLHPAAAHDDDGDSVYGGPRTRAVDLPKLKGVAMTGDFEGQVTFGLAFDSRPDYTVRELRDPQRVVIDIAH